MGTRPKNYLPNSEEERLRMIAWYNLEKECDVHNVDEFLSMDQSHLTLKKRTMHFNRLMKNIDKSKKQRNGMREAIKSKIFHYNLNADSRTWLPSC